MRNLNKCIGKLMVIRLFMDNIKGIKALNEKLESNSKKRSYYVPDDIHLLAGFLERLLALLLSVPRSSD